ncbi:MAG: guanylate kinase [Candidatus Aminicenantales bacterium]
MIFVITGPSGCGKSTLVHRILKELDNVAFSISHTTRERRPSEEDGRDYYFVGEAEFKSMIEKKKFVEWAVVHGNYYGTSRRELEKKAGRGDLLLDIDVQGAQQVKNTIKKAVFVFVLPPSFEELKRRLENRGQESPEAIKMRLEVARKEIRHYAQFDYVIVNDSLEKAAEELKAIILCQRCRIESQKKEILPILRSFTAET